MLASNYEFLGCPPTPTPTPSGVPPPPPFLRAKRRILFQLRSNGLEFSVSQPVGLGVLFGGPPNFFMFKIITALGYEFIKIQL